MFARLHPQRDDIVFLVKNAYTTSLLPTGPGKNSIPTNFQVQATSLRAHVNSKSSLIHKNIVGVCSGWKEGTAVYTNQIGLPRDPCQQRDGDGDINDKTLPEPQTCKLVVEVSQKTGNRFYERCTSPRGLALIVHGVSSRCK